MLTTEMVPLLSCPECQARLRADIENQNGDKIEAGQLICDKCGNRYDIHSGIPNLVPPTVDSSEQWELWKQHLEGLDARRQERKNVSGRLPHPSGRATHVAFFEFAGIEHGTVLDVGCGPGKLRNYLDETRVTYFGLDPLPMEESKDFRFVHALGEYIPFVDSTFTHMLVIAALDHFNDLDRFFGEARRVLKQDGSLLILQSTHDVTGPVSLVKLLVHLMKDKLDSRATTRRNAKVPKHMNEFSKSKMLDMASKYFVLDKIADFSKSWYSPRKLFVSFRPIRVNVEKKLVNA